MSILVLAVDPGKLSGVAAISWDEDKDSTPKVVWSKELNDEQFPEGIIDALADAESYDKFFVACESFTINMQTAKNTQAPWSLEQIGVLKYVCRKYNYKPEDIVFQSPANAKSMFDNPALKRLGTWHVGGAGHANDAIRHGLLRMIRAGWIPRKLLS